MRAGSPTVDTLVLFALVALAQLLLGLAGLAVPLALVPPVDVHPWTLVTSVYAHASLPHLLGNTLALLVFGFLAERVTTRWRFHAFFVSVGVLAGIAQVWVGALVGPARGVVGASGALFGLFGYLLAGNWLARVTVGRFELSVGQQVALLVLVAAVVTAVTATARAALVAHFAGLVLGLVAGRFRLLHVDSRRNTRYKTADR